MKPLVRYVARLAAAVCVLAIMIGPIVAVAAAAGNPFPADLFSRVSARNVDDATIIKLLSVLFYVCLGMVLPPGAAPAVPLTATSRADRDDEPPHRDTTPRRAQ